ncbi:hypothetical protein Zmor_023834 [Zophobas morio]|uniref:Zinc finger PHD-type domain-containing protein n=1 Tax=Zophobas morio TaxID=2755281 RepID=A0AA38M7Q8_9CUCU|nr:hypothetical protein Zmor_023834 [Zophobas morio]
MSDLRQFVDLQAFCASESVYKTYLKAAASDRTKLNLFLHLIDKKDFIVPDEVFKWIAESESDFYTLDICILLQRKQCVDGYIDAFLHVCERDQIENLNYAALEFLGIINATPEIVEAKRLHAEKEAKSLRTAGKKASKNLKNVFEPNESDNSEDDPYETDDEYGDTVCIYCNELFSHSRPKEVWLQCQKCLQWCHIDCAGVSSKTKRFTCDLCK